jgi:hypothetical protein
MADIGNWLILLVTVLVFVVLLYTLETTEIFILAHANMILVQTLQILHPPHRLHLVVVVFVYGQHNPMAHGNLIILSATANAVVLLLLLDFREIFTKTPVTRMTIYVQMILLVQTLIQTLTLIQSPVLSA